MLLSCNSDSFLRIFLSFFQLSGHLWLTVVDDSENWRYIEIRLRYALFETGIAFASAWCLRRTKYWFMRVKQVHGLKFLEYAKVHSWCENTLHHCFMVTMSQKYFSFPFTSLALINHKQTFLLSPRVKVIVLIRAGSFFF